MSDPSSYRHHLIKGFLYSFMLVLLFALALPTLSQTGIDAFEGRDECALTMVKNDSAPTVSENLDSCAGQIAQCYNNTLCHQEMSVNEYGVDYELTTPMMNDTFRFHIRKDKWSYVNQTIENFMAEPVDGDNA